MECPKCGWTVPEGAEACRACGAPVAVAPPPSAAVDAAAVGSAKAGPDDVPATDALVAVLFASPSVTRSPIVAQPTPPPETRPRADEPPPPAEAEIDIERLWKPVPGPVDRESFFDAQRRHRRATWRQMFFFALAALITGLPLSLVFTPVLFAIVLVVTRLAHVVVPLPDVVWDTYRNVALIVVDGFRYFDDQSTADVSVWAVVLGAIVWLLPGMLAMLLLLPALRALLRRAGAGGTLLALGARDPRPGDLEERQLVNVVEEMAIAAGLPPPRVMLLDTSVANAAVVGSSPADATVVVSRPLLEDLDRDQTQGILANLIAQIGNGDLGLALSVIAVYQTFGFASAFLRVPISSEARATVWRLVRFALSPRRHSEASEARAISRLLTRGVGDAGEDDLGRSLEISERDIAPRPGPSLKLLWAVPYSALGVFVGGLLLGWSMAAIRWAWLLILALAVALIWYQWRYFKHQVYRGYHIARSMLILPYYMAVMMPQMMLLLLVPFLLEPMIALAWRQRRYLADADAVQLTRNPDGLAGGLRELVRRGGLFPGGKWAAPLFVVGPEAQQARGVALSQAIMRRRIEQQEPRDTPPGTPHSSDGLRGDIRLLRSTAPQQHAEVMRQVVEEAAEEAAEDGAGPEMMAGSSSVIGFHPPLKRRLQKLRALGSSIEPIEVDHRSFAARRMFSKPGSILLSLLVFVLGIVVVALMLVALALMAALSLFFTSLLMMLVYGLFMLLVPA
jgi:Zn-dependent protease with chaperone function